jgi:hypothetical protein
VVAWPGRRERSSALQLLVVIDMKPLWCPWQDSNLQPAPLGDGSAQTPCSSRELLPVSWDREAEGYRVVGSLVFVMLASEKALSRQRA